MRSGHAGERGAPRLDLSGVGRTGGGGSESESEGSAERAVCQWRPECARCDLERCAGAAVRRPLNGAAVHGLRRADDGGEEEGSKSDASGFSEAFGWANMRFDNVFILEEGTCAANYLAGTPVSCSQRR